MSRFINFLIEAVEVSNTKFAVALQFIGDGGVSHRQAISKIVKSLPKISESGWSIKSLPNNVFSFNTKLMPCERQYFKELIKFVTDMKDKNNTDNFTPKTYPNREQEVQEAFTTNRSQVSTLFISNPDLTEDSFAWFVYQTAINKDMLKKAKLLQDSYSIAVFKSGMDSQYISSLRKAEKSRDKTQIVGLLKNKNALNMNFVTNAKGDKMLSVNIGELSDSTAGKIISFSTIKSLLVDVLDYGLGIQGSSSFNSYQEFEKVYKEFKVEEPEGTTENPDGTTDTSADNSATSKQNTKDGGINYTDGTDTLVKGIALYDWFNKNSANINGIVSKVSGAFMFNGTWKAGRWKGNLPKATPMVFEGTWENGEWESGLFMDGTWKTGTWTTGTWRKGSWYDGVWRGGDWQSGEIYSKMFRKLMPSSVNPNAFATIEKASKDYNTFVINLKKYTGAK